MPDELDTTWERIHEELRGTVTDLTFHLWLEPLELAWRERDALYVRAPRHIRTLVEERYLSTLRRAGSRVLGDAVTVQVVGEDWHAPGSDEALESGRSSREPTLDLFNPRYTFERFVIGDGNRLAHAAALATAEMPGQAYNPLFIYGPPGLGKTHLLHAIGNYVQAHGCGMVVRYATVETFTNEFVQAVRAGRTENFKGRFRKPDVLLIDDVQFLANKVRTEEEFFHTFNALYEAGRQLVITSDRSPVDMGTLEARLQERFACGLVAELEAPSLEVRLAILRKRAAVDALVEVGDETLGEVARHVTSSVRALEGALIRVVAYASLQGRPATPDVARHVLGRLYPHSEESPCTVEQIQAATAATFGIDQQSLLAHDRRPAVAFARQVAMYLARELTDQSLPTIGASFGGRNHSTILHAHRKISRALEQDEAAARTVDKLRRQLIRVPDDRQGCDHPQVVPASSKAVEAELERRPAPMQTYPQDL